MFKRILLVAAIVVLMAPMSACTKACITTWIFADDEMQGARVGWQDEAAGIEAGITSWWFDSEPKSYGVYGIWHLPDPVELPNFFGIGPETLKAFPYIGAQVSAAIDSDDEGDLYGPIIGFLIQDLISIEYQYRIVDNEMETWLDDEHELSIGVLWRW